jgi:transposase
MKQIYFIGIDVSKKKVDVAVINSANEILAEKVVCNDRRKLTNFISAFMRKQKAVTEQVLICCEDTGVYSKPLKDICHEQGWSLWVENAYKIKKAASDIRGKSDRKDALRIAEYALRYQDRQHLYAEPGELQNKLQTLLGARETLLDQTKRIKQQLSETKAFDPARHKLLTDCYKKTLRTLEKEFKAIEQQIWELVEQHKELSGNVDLLRSIPGIGLQSALNFIVYTRNFTTFNSAKHLACYAGVVPFPNQSGTMHKRDRVSSFANKKLKKLLHLAAMAATKVKGEIQQYYIRKVKEGKNKMSVLNAIRNKLVKRMFVVVQRQSPYVVTKEENLSIN